MEMRAKLNKFLLTQKSFARSPARKEGITGKDDLL
jgi:hypothetical protein